MQTALRHLAVVVDGACPPPAEGRPSAAAGGEILSAFARLASLAFDMVPPLACLSLFSPELQDPAAVPPPGSGSTPLEEGLSLLEDAVRSLGASLRFFGDPSPLPARWAALYGPSAGGKERRVQVFYRYSSRQEIAAAAGRLLSSRLDGEAGEEAFSSCLLTAGQPDPDLIVFAGGALEPKDFLLWQSSYSELWHAPGSGLEFSRGELDRALEGFRTRDRRFGRV